jgi:hypothetical protein
MVYTEHHIPVFVTIVLVPINPEHQDCNPESSNEEYVNK